MKTFLLDANIPLHDSNAIFKFGDNEVVFPAIVIEEVDAKKNEETEVGQNARKFMRHMKKLRKNNEGKLSTGVPLETGGSLRVELNHMSLDGIKKSYQKVINDNKILAVVLNLKSEFEKSLSEEVKVRLDELTENFRVGKLGYVEYWDSYYELTGRLFTFITNDNNLIIKADTVGLKVEEYENDRIDNLDSVHKGYHTIYTLPTVIDEYYKKGSLDLNYIEDDIKKSLELKTDDNLTDFVFAQDFLILKDICGSKQSGLGRVIRQGNSAKLVSLVLDEIEKEYKEKNAKPPTIFGINPLNVEQKMFMELLLDPNVSLVLGIGPSGTGKTLLALAAALQQTEFEDTYRKILAARPVIPMGKDIGYIPGTKEDKLRQWMQPIYDNLEFLLGLEREESTYEDSEGKKRRTVDDEINRLNIELEALTYMRGRTIPYQFTIFDEGQNMSGFEGKSTITRAGFGTKIVLLGDPEQIDHPYLDSTNNALTYVSEKMKREADVGIIRLTKTERSPLAEKAAKLL